MLSPALVQLKPSIMDKLNSYIHNGIVSDIRTFQLFVLKCLKMLQRDICKQEDCFFSSHGVIA